VDIRVTVVAESVEISAEGQYNYAINVRPPGTGVAGLNTTPLLVFQYEAPTSGIGRVRVTNTGAYVAKISFYYYNSAGTLVQTGEGGDLLAGQTTDYDPGVFGVPLNAHFFANMRAVAGGSNLATEEFVYTGSEAYARYTSGGTTLINRSFTFNGIAAPVDVPQDDVPLASRAVSFGLANDERFSIEGFFTVFTPTGSTTVDLGGLEGKRAFQESSSGTPTQLRSVFSWIEVADKFIEDYYFEFEENGVHVKINFYYIIG